MLSFSLAIIIFFAAFTQTVTGFGMALLAMPLLTATGMPLHIASPLVALVGLAFRPFLLVAFRESFSIQKIWRLALASLVGVPLGVYLLIAVDANLVKRAFGLVVAAYALFALSNYYIPPMSNRLWAFGLGFIAGIMGGAYNIPGPPLIIYATGRRWPPAEFKSNLQALAVMNSVAITLAHIQVNHFTGDVIQLFVLTFPFSFLGFVAGYVFDRYIPENAFRILVLGLLLVTGLSLVFG